MSTIFSNTKSSLLFLFFWGENISTSSSRNFKKYTTIRILSDQMKESIIFPNILLIYWDRCRAHLITKHFNGGILVEIPGELLVKSLSTKIIEQLFVLEKTILISGRMKISSLMVIDYWQWWKMSKRERDQRQFPQLCLINLLQKAQI